MTTTYVNRAFPHSVGGPGPVDIIAVTIGTANCTAQTDLVAYYAANSTSQTRHDNFSFVVNTMSRYGRPVDVVSTSSSVVTMRFERQGMYADSSLGKPDFSNFVTARLDAFELAQLLLESNGGITTCD